MENSNTTKKGRSRILMTEAEAKSVEKRLEEMAAKDPPLDQIVYCGVAIIERFGVSIGKARARGWTWESIRSSLPSSVQTLKPRTLERYFQIYSTKKGSSRVPRKLKTNSSKSVTAAVRPADKEPDGSENKPKYKPTVV